MVVLVLAMLTVIGVLFSLTVSIHLKTNIMYREQSEVDSAAWMGLQRFSSELMYKVWGANEIRAFTSADGTPLGVPFGEKVGEFSFGTYVGDPNDIDLPPVAYFKSRTDPAGESAVEKIARPWSRYVQSVVTLDHGPEIAVKGPNWGSTWNKLPNTYATLCAGNENDYRWLVSSDIWGGKNAAIIAERMLDARLNDDKTPRAVESGGLYHDEFLPTGLSNADLFEAGLHYNHGTIYGRSPWYTENCTVHGYAQLAYDRNSYTFYSGWGQIIKDYSTGFDFEGGGYLSEYWGRVWRGNKQTGYNASLGLPDPIDPRQAGDSFYRIFRFDLIDPIDFKVRGTGVDPDKPGRCYGNAEIYSSTDYAKDSSGKRIIRATHLGSASSSPGDNVRSHKYNNGTYEDYLGDAINPNQVNLNYPYELFTGQGGVNQIPSERFFHYNESKWIYLYDHDDPERQPWARYALMVWPDSGLLNVNAITEGKRWYWGTTGELNGARTYRRCFLPLITALDVGTGESGGPTNDYGGSTDKEGTFLVSGVRVMGQMTFSKLNTSTEPTNYDSLLLTAFNLLDDHKWQQGPFGSRAELETIIRKRVFRDKDGDLLTQRAASAAKQLTLGGKTLAELTANDMRLHDARLIANYTTPHSYEYTLDPHWEHDRLIFDAGSEENWYMAALGIARGRRASKNGSAALAPYTPGGFCGTSGDAAAVQTRKRFGDICASLKNFYGPYSVPIAGGALDVEAQPGLPLSPFLDDYSKTKDFAGSHTYAGPSQAKKGKAMVLSTLLNALYHGDGYYTLQRQSFAVDAADPSAAPLINATPKDVILSGKRYILEQADSARISEVGSGIFTVPVGPKIMDPDFDHDAKKRLLVSHVDMVSPGLKSIPYFVQLDWSAPIHCMIPGCVQCPFSHHYGFETKWLNFIELTTTETKTTLSTNWFLRVYGNVRNWEGKCVDEDGNEVETRLVEDGGVGYVDLFAKVKTIKIADGHDADGDGNFFSKDDTPPKYEIDKNVKGWQDNVFYDPDHYIEGVVLRYRGPTTTGNRDRADEEGWFIHDSNNDSYKTYDRDWRVDYRPKEAGEPEDYWQNPFMKPKFDDHNQVRKDADGKWYDIREGKNGKSHLLNPNGVVGDNIPDEDWGRPDTADGKADNGDKSPDGKIDGASGYYDESNVKFWRSFGGPTDYMENLADWLTGGKYYYEEDVQYEKIDDQYSGRNWNQVEISRATGGEVAVYRFGSYTPFYQYDNAYTGGRWGGASHVDNMSNEVKLGDPHSGLEHLRGPEQQPYGYVLVVFPHARTPWTRRGEDWDKHFGRGHFDDKVKYPDVSDASPRKSNYADGDAVAVGYFAQDGYKKEKMGLSEDKYKNQPRAVNWVNLNGKHPDFAAAGGKSGPACAFSRSKACISGGSFIVDGGGGITNEHCEEALPGGKKQTFPSEVGRGFACRDIRDNCDPWMWDATFWDWSRQDNNDPLLAPDPTKPFTFVQQTPALTSFDQRRVSQGAVHEDLGKVFVSMWNEPVDTLGPGRLNKHVHGRNANSIFHQLDQGDPTAENPGVTDSAPNAAANGPIVFQYPRLRLLPDYTDHDYDGQPDVTIAGAVGTGAAAGKGRFPYPISSNTNARPSKSLAAMVMDGQLTAWIYEDTADYGGGDTPTNFRDRLWLKHAALGTGDLRTRGWSDILHYSRADEYFDSDAMSAARNMLAPAWSPIRDMLDNNLTGASESGGANRGFTTKPLWGRQWRDGQFSSFNEAGRYWADRKIVKRININEMVSPPTVRALLTSDREGAPPFEHTGATIPTTFIGNKPQRGYPYVNSWRQWTTTIKAVRFNALWRENLWADASAEVSTCFYGSPSPEGVNRKTESGWVSAATVAPSPVYTAFILAQRLDVDGQGLCEERIRVTFERTWDGKMHVLEFRSSSQE
jgi:hypothetical protein